MSDKYEGKIGPVNAMSALEPAFGESYHKAVSDIMKAVTEFERTTGRVVDNISLERIDVTSLGAVGKESIQQVSLHFLPTPREVSW